MNPNRDTHSTAVDSQQPEDVSAQSSPPYGASDAKDVDKPTPSQRLVDEPNSKLARPGHHLTDAGNAIRLVETHGADLRYVPAWGTWLIWGGTRWRRDDR